MGTGERERTIAIAAVLLMAVTCLLAVGASFAMRSDAMEELASARETLSRLAARARPPADRDGGAVAGTAPAAAFLDAATQGLAAAQLQAYLSQLALAERAVLISSGVQPANRDDEPDSIRLEATLNMTLPTLQTMLYRLESGTPYVFVEALNVQPPGAATQHGAQNVMLRVTVSLRALWRRRTV
jgi:general secretion pathway protein M